MPFDAKYYYDRVTVIFFVLSGFLWELHLFCHIFEALILVNFKFVVFIL